MLKLLAGGVAFGLGLGQLPAGFALVGSGIGDAGVPGKPELVPGHEQGTSEAEWQ